MKTWKECCEEAGYDAYTPYPVMEFKYFAYKNGKVVGEYDSFRAAAGFGVVETVAVNEEDYNKAKAERKAAENRAIEIWYAALREEYSYLNDAVFGLCYDMAYEDGHSAGYNEVANCMIGIVDFAQKVISASNK